MSMEFGFLFGFDVWWHLLPMRVDNGTSKRENEGNHYNFVFGMTLVIFLTWCSCRRVDPYLSIYLIHSCIFLKKLSRGKASTAWSMLLSMSKLNLVMTTVVAYSVLCCGNICFSKLFCVLITSTSRGKIKQYLNGNICFEWKKWSIPFQTENIGKRVLGT
jgi:hypothetical protein